MLGEGGRGVHQRSLGRIGVYLRCLGLEGFTCLERGSPVMFRERGRGVHSRCLVLEGLACGGRGVHLRCLGRRGVQL